jgi:hypothetical protein
LAVAAREDSFGGVCLDSIEKERLVKSLALIGLFALSSFAYAEAPLDPAYKDLKHPKVDDRGHKAESKSDTLSLITKQTPVRSQMSRGTCSIFSATALIESLLIINNRATSEIDLSEEWLQYASVRNKQSDGSSAPSNFNALKTYGLPTEATLPYIGDDWNSELSGVSELKSARCSHLWGSLQKSCFITHFDPRFMTMSDAQLLDVNAVYRSEVFVNARREAAEFRDTNLRQNGVRSYGVSSVTTIKSQLRAGTPIVLEMDFYYGAWNHRLADELSIGRDMEAWAKGVIGYPEYGSVDRTRSPEKRAGHSILVVGYDDEKVVTTNVLMNDGTTKQFTYKGVYYFKNSWGTSSFGSQFEVDGEIVPGYGMITQKYAHEQGAFYRLQ